MLTSLFFLKKIGMNMFFSFQMLALHLFLPLLTYTLYNLSNSLHLLSRLLYMLSMFTNKDYL
jgi:hypothetical protein